MSIFRRRTPQGYGPVPLTVGATGHRELHPDDVAVLEERVRAFLKDLQSKYPHTRLRLLSALAEGADRLVARVALDLGIVLIVPLPMPLAEYEKDFNTPASRKELSLLLLRAERVLVVPGSGDDRDDGYTRLAQWLAHHSQIILALWDGVDNRKSGGTAEVVRLKRYGIPDDSLSDEQPLDPGDTGPVHVIPTRRAADKADAIEIEKARNPHNRRREKDAEDTFESVCRRTEEFNLNAVVLAERLTKSRSDSRKHLVSTLRDESAAAELAPTIELYTHADTLAKYFQRRTLLALDLLFLFVFLAVVSFTTFAHEIFGHDKEHALLFGYLILFFAAVMVDRYVRDKRYQDRYLDYRALAEGLRVQFYWRVAGISESTADRYLSHQSDELDWIRDSLRACEVVIDQERIAIGPAGLQYASEAWVRRQRGFFRSRVHHEHRVLESFEMAVRALAVFGLLITIVFEVRLLAKGLKEIGMSLALPAWMFAERTQACLIVLIALPAAGAALAHGYTEKRALASHLKRYRRIRAVFENANERLVRHLERGDDASARRVLRDLGREALEENGDWVILHRDRPLEVPQPA
jgi:hypothetical protein